MHLTTKPSHVTHDSTIRRIADNVRAEMARTGLSQTALAERISLSQTALSRRLSGGMPFDVRELDEIANALDVSLTTLVETPKASA